MRSTDAIPPTDHPAGRSTNGKCARRWATLLLLIALVLSALPQPTPVVAQPDPVETLIPATIPNTTGSPSDAAVPSDEPPTDELEATSAPTEPAQDGPLADAVTLSPSVDAAVELPASSNEPDPALTVPAVTDPPTTIQASEELSVVTATDAGLPVVCQLVIRATALVPPPGTAIGDPLPDPVAGAAFDVSVAGGGSIILLTNSLGVLNLSPQVLADSGLAVATGDTVTVAQIGTRAGLTLGDPAFAMTFAWQATVSMGCRVEVFVVNPLAVAPPSATAPASVTGQASPSANPTGVPSIIPSPSPFLSASPSPSPAATATRLAVTSTTVPTATTVPTIPVGFGQIDVIVVARPSPGASPGATQLRLAGARLTIVNRTGRVLTATITTGSDGSAMSPLLAIGSYDLILDNPPVGYLGAQAQGFDVASPTLQHFVFQLEPNTASAPSPSVPASARPSALPGTATATVRASNTPAVSPTARATSTALAATATVTTQATTATATATTRAGTATVQATTATTLPTTATATVRTVGTVSAATATQRPARATSTPTGTAGAGSATATPRPATATVSATTPPAPATVPATATTHSTIAAMTATVTARPATVVATATSASPTGPVVTGTPPRPTRAPATSPVATATRTPTPGPAGTTGVTATRTPIVLTSTTVTGASALGHPTRSPATIPGTPTRVTQTQDASITVYVSICIDPRFIDFGEFGSETDLGPRYLTDIDRSRCRPAWSGETRITLTSTYPNYLPAYAQTNSTDADGRLSFDFPAAQEQRIGSLHLEGPIPAQDAGVKITPGRVLIIPLTLVILDPAAQARETETMAGSGPAVTGDPAGWLPGTLAIIGLPLVLVAVRRYGHHPR